MIYRSGLLINVFFSASFVLTDHQANVLSASSSTSTIRLRYVLVWQQEVVVSGIFYQDSGLVVLHT